MKRIVLSVLQIFGYIILVTIFTVALMMLTQTFLGDWETGDPWLELLGEGLLTSLGIALTNLVIYFISKSRVVLRGWPRLRPALSWFGKGALAGFAMASLMLLLTIALGGGRLVFDHAAISDYLMYVLLFGGGLLLSSLSEEWLFRGYPLVKLSEILGRGWANLVLSLLFAAAHLGSQGINNLVIFNIVLGSLVLGAMRFSPGGIPAAWGFHFAWNYTQILSGATLSLENVAVPGVTFTPSGPTALSGGAFGPEAGIGATISTIIFIILIIAYFRRQGFPDLPIPWKRSDAQYH